MNTDRFERLVVGISSRALFDLREEDEIFRTKGLEEYRRYQIEHEKDARAPGVGFAMAKTLDTEDEMVLIGAGEKGKDPLIFQHNGSPYRGFLEGRIDGDRYQLLLHLSNLELKRPEESA